MIKALVHIGADIEVPETLLVRNGIESVVGEAKMIVEDDKIWAEIEFDKTKLINMSSIPSLEIVKSMSDDYCKAVGVNIGLYNMDQRIPQLNAEFSGELSSVGGDNG